MRPLLQKNLNYNFQQPEMQSSTWNVGPNRNFDLHLKPELTSLPSTMQSHANSRRLTPPRSYLSLTFSRSKLQHLRFKSSTPILSSSSKTFTFRSTPWIPDWRHWNPRLTAKHSFFEDYQLQNLQLTTSNGTSFYIVHEEQGPIVALRLSIIIQQLFHHYQVDTGLTTDVHRCNNLIVQKQCPLCDHHLHFIKNERKSYQHILSSSFELINTLQFDYIVDELTNFFLGMDLYTNNELTHFNSICTCFTDVAYNLLMFVDLGLGISFRFPIEAKGGTTPLPDTIPPWAATAGRGRQRLAGKPRSI